jgi:hypothetical protein
MGLHSLENITCSEQDGKVDKAYGQNIPWQKYKYVTSYKISTL